MYYVSHVHTNTYIHLIWYMPYMVSLKLLRWHLTHGKKRCTKAHHAKNSCSVGLPSIFLFSSLHVSVIIWLQNGAIHCRFCLVHWVGCRMIKVWMLFKASVKPGTTHFTCCEVFSCLPTASRCSHLGERQTCLGEHRDSEHTCAGQPCVFQALSFLCFDFIQCKLRQAILTQPFPQLA